jgi:sigma54-dependent transcription regulator
MDRNAPDSHDGHFEEDDIDLLAWLRWVGPRRESGSAEVERLSRHAANCWDCRHKVEMREEEIAAMKHLWAEVRRDNLTAIKGLSPAWAGVSVK